MSASEKLKALGVWEEQGWDSGPFDVCSRDQADTLHGALPQIVAVVEATEVCALDPVYLTEPYSKIKGHPAAGELIRRIDVIRDALTALEEALPGAGQSYISDEPVPVRISRDMETGGNT